MAKGEDDFFNEQTVSSRVKAGIISEYFPSYCKIISSKYAPHSIRYIDLFAGPGVYGDNKPSTPILVARHVRNNPVLLPLVELIFNDKYYAEELESNFRDQFPDRPFKRLHFGKSVVGESEQITAFLKKDTHHNGRNLYPSLLFIDPFGYKGIETKVLAEFLKNWGNEIFLFVNTKRIHPALENEKFEPLMQDLFPSTLTQIKNDRRFKSTVAERLNLIIDSLGKEYNAILKTQVFYTAFKFQEEDSDGTSHYILHFTKGPRGFDLVKTIYNDFANVGTMFDGVNTYTFDAKQLDEPISLFDYKSINIDKLKDELQTKFSGRTITADRLFELHQMNQLYCRAHYQEALRRLVDEGKLKSDFTDNKNHKKSVILSKYCTLKFN